MGSNPCDPEASKPPCRQELSAQVNASVWHSHFILSAPTRRCEKNVLASNRNSSVRPSTEYSNECRQNHSGCAPSHQRESRHRGRFQKDPQGLGQQRSRLGC